MCKSLQTAEGQKNIPDFLKYGFGEGRQDVRNSPVDPDSATEVPLSETVDPNRMSILLRRERMRKAEQERQQKNNPGSNVPTTIRTRKDILNEIT